MKKFIFIFAILLNFAFGETFNCCQYEYPTDIIDDWKGCAYHLVAVYRNGILSGSLSTYMHTKTRSSLGGDPKRTKLVEQKHIVAGDISNPIAISNMKFEVKQFIFNDDDIEYPFIWSLRIDYFSIDLTKTELNKIRYRNNHGDSCLNISMWE